MKQLAVYLILWLACLGLFTACREPGPRATILSYGMIEKGALDVTEGQTRTASRPVFTVKTKEIPARKGVMFGFDYEVSNMNFEMRTPLKAVVLHPLIRAPDDSVSTRFTFDLKSMSDDRSERGKIGFRFDHEHELVPGIWTLQLWHAGQMLVEKEFVVVKAN